MLSGCVSFGSVMLSLVALFQIFYRISATSQPSSELESAEESAHSYTNIEFARESIHGTPRRIKGGFGQGSNRYAGLFREWISETNKFIADSTYM